MLEYQHFKLLLVSSYENRFAAILRCKTSKLLYFTINRRFYSYLDVYQEFKGYYFFNVYDPIYRSLRKNVKFCHIKSTRKEAF